MLTRSRFTIAAVLMLSAGCSKLFRPSVSSAAVTKAIEQGDTAYLTEACKADVGNPSYRACQHIKQKAVENHTDCATFVEAYKETPDGDYAEYEEIAARRFAKCGQYTNLFERTRNDPEVLLKLEREGLPIEAEFVKYAQSHQGEAFLQTQRRSKFHITQSLGEWLSGAGHLQHCDLLVSALEKAPAEIKAGALPYFVAAKCSAGYPLVFGAVADLPPEDRIFVCDQFAECSDPGVIPKLSIIARTDSHSQVKEVTGEKQGTYGVRVYPVREACSEAIAKLQLRAPE